MRHAWRWWVSTLLFGPLLASAQFNPATGQPFGNAQGVQNPLDPTRRQDTSRIDTSDTRKVPRKVQVVRAATFLRSDQFLDSLPPLNIHRYTFWDETDTLPGFLQRLGQVGKPYQRYQFGLPARLLHQPRYYDPLTGAEWAYILNPTTEIPLLDTRTLFSEVAFHQLDNDQQLLRVVLSQNVTPFWNWTVSYRRRTAQGRYFNQRTDQYNIAASTYYRSFDRRIAAFLNAGYNEINDQISGGIRNGGTLPLTDDSLDNAAQVLVQPRLFTRVRTVTAGGTYQLLGDTLNNISLVAGLNYTDHNHYWHDALTRPEELFANPAAFRRMRNRPYANLFYDPRTIPPNARYLQGSRRADSLGVVDVGYKAIVREAQGGVRFNARLWRFQSRHDVQVTYASNTYWGDTLQGLFGIQKQGLRYAATTEDTAAVQGFRLQWLAQVQRNNRMATELFGQVTANWTIGRQRYEVRDSIWREERGRWVRRPITFRGQYAPLQFELNAMYSNQNPTVFDRFWNTLTYQPNASLANETVLLLRGWAQYTAPVRSRRGVAFLPSYVRAGAFVSRRGSAILYDSLGAAVQLPSGATLQWTGLELSGRGRLGRFYLEADITAQSSTADPAAAPYGETQPRLYGRLSLYYQNKFLRQGNTYVHLGFDVWHASRYRGLHFDPSTIRFYPQTAPQLDGYTRVDAVITANILTAVAFVKLQNVLAGIPDANYVTTPWYPELRRTFVWGVGWRLYD